MNIRHGNIRINAMSRDKLKAFVEQGEPLEKLLRLDGVEDSVRQIDFRAILDGCDPQKPHDEWHTAWVVISRLTGKAIGVLRFAFSDAEPAAHEITLPFPSGSPFPEEMGEAFLMLCRWATDFDRIARIRSAASDAESRTFLEAHGFCNEPENGEDMVYRKPRQLWSPLTFCVGLGTGCVLGSVLGSLLIGIAIGGLMGVVAGILIDNAEMKAWEKNQKE